jgi:hypothetical protein
MSMALRLGALLALAVIPTGAGATAGQPCIAIADLVSASSFRKFPAASEHGPWRAPDARFGQAHEFRTVLRNEGVGPPNLAGHYKIVHIGCGTSCIHPAFVDLTTGQVTFEPALGSVELEVEIDDVPGIHDFRLVSRRDSRLLVVVGTRNEDERTTGVTMFEWGKEHPRLVRFIPQSALCRSLDWE